ncbi:meiotic nuclear division protein 1 homolog [Homarus americanus]|uniref:Meiotic nuclear division protein 1 homolog n=1 Tax=Homarus americanus TaxID=6706 RepID=A0A8J5MJQ3_HOMAM|nr:meiotic nuclear division protein 1 homolog [Homarus americanus]XP_042208545.1 meiotic nuclear division protein 1 homolog [Homarus americanus]XP_042208546.1 meiotic nuclear division protein 1 homolog [Homarus americanus]XP_042208547.1 meiotic nuclear division protein 1 homolog [Homarus americanus]XP_042208548.1 meiotic nuclear division protein 1 homolog [Homarus americanus]XP_042208551.1 meiotic nuclear division protein 1 homolog [Homarus americanus]XP_042208552.1 meiotic nuclear division p
MSRRKGLSHEEKRQKMMELFYEKKEFFQLKELEKLGPKEKGVIAQAVKDVVQSLVDDAMVDTDKIGTCVYFWAFPSKALSTRKRKIDNLNSRLEDTNKRLKTALSKLEQAKVGREESEDRGEILERMSQLETTKDQLVKDIQKYHDCDPEVLNQMKAETQIAQVACNRWTDNIFAIKSWCKNKFFIEEEVLNKQFNIPGELDYI